MKIKITAEGAARLEQVIEWLRAIRDTDDNRAFGMSYWSCGTSMCIGGKAASLAGLKMIPMVDTPVIPENQVMAEQACGLAPGDGDTLFFDSEWPEDLRDEYDDSYNDQKARCNIAIERIERFLRDEVEVEG